MKHTTVKEMTDKVNELLELLDKARDMAYELRVMNVKNRINIITNSDEAVAEVRPLTMQERKEEAERYIDIFENVQTALTEAETSIFMNY